MTEPSEPHVGIHLRSIRDQQGLSLRALSERCGLSINAISLIERGENSPTVSTLHRLATALSVPITDFFLEGEEKQKIVFTKRDMGLRSQVNGTVMESLDMGLFNQQLEPLLITISPGAGNLEDAVTHSGEEFVYCLEGEIEYSIGDRTFQIEKGDRLLFDATQLHAFRNVNGKPASMLLIFYTGRNRQRARRLHLK